MRDGGRAERQKESHEATREGIAVIVEGSCEERELGREALMEQKRGFSLQLVGK